MLVKAGSLVNFKTGVQSWALDYVQRSPGIVRWVSYTEKAPRGCACVYWRNGETTTEHLSYLEIVGG